MIYFNFDRDCCGCRACADACTRQAIFFSNNKTGFAVPHVLSDKCTNCGLCEKVCPITNKSETKVTPRLFAAYHLDENIRREGSSGSLFYTLARYVIEEKSGYVCGAAFDENLKLKHFMISSMDDLPPLMKSKYLQSDTSGIYAQVRKKLKDNQHVLFVGTPCQVNALHNFLGRKAYENLITVDFICHGVPNQELFDKSIRAYEQKHNCKVVRFTFRKKSQDFLQNCLINRQFCNGEVDEVVVNPMDFPFYCAFKQYFTFRNSCYQCKFVGKDRVADFTLGDFWGYAHLDRIKDFNKGYSQVYVNSVKAQKMFGKIKDQCWSEEVDPNSIVAENKCYLLATHKSIINRLFMHDYPRLPYEKLELRYMLNPRKMGVLKHVIWSAIWRLGF